MGYVGCDLERLRGARDKEAGTRVVSSTLEDPPFWSAHLHTARVGGWPQALGLWFEPKRQSSFPSRSPSRETSFFHIQEGSQHSQYYFTWWQLSDTGEASQRLDGALGPCRTREAGRGERPGMGGGPKAITVW